MSTMAAHDAGSLEEQIEQWRSHLRRRRGIQTVDAAELEDHLREQIAALVQAGLAPDEAFLVAVRRLGALDPLSREFAREHSERLWKQLVVVPSDADDLPPARARTEAIVAAGLAVAAAIAVKVPALFGMPAVPDDDFHARNASLFVLPLLTGYFAWKRRLDGGTLRWLAVIFALAVVVANVHPFAPGSATQGLTTLHLPIALWLVVGVAYAGGRWRGATGRMDFVRFSGELVIYYVLITLGGGVLMGLVASIFGAIGVDVERLIEAWLLPCGAAGAVLLASWLVEAKQSVVENLAPVLTRLFTPLFTAALLAFLATLLWTGRGVALERNVLIGFDLLLVLVLALLLYSLSARDSHAPPGAFDVMQVVLVASALLADAAALWAIGARIVQLGVTPNRVAALGVNVLLLVNLAWSAVLYLRFLRGRAPIARLERWQTDYLPAYAVWAAIVVVVFPPLFGYA
jgi:hypothetical protein